MVKDLSIKSSEAFVYKKKTGERVNMQPYIIGISGGSGSGKTTFCKQLLLKCSKRITIVKQDNYYLSNENITSAERKVLNYDCPEAFETSLLIDHLEKLKNGHQIEAPTYDYATHTRNKKKERSKPESVIIVEGILLFHEERLRNLIDLKIFIYADPDIRILNRIERDVRERKRELSDIREQYLKTVKPMHEKYVEPTKNFADLIINSGNFSNGIEIISNKICHLLENK